MRVKLSKNFYQDEFECHCGCGFDTVDPELIEVVQDVRDHFNKPITINCGCRCPAHNANTKGAAKNSQHQYGRAADIVVQGVSPIFVRAYLLHKYPDKYGIGKYRSFTHIDTRPNGPARW